MSICKLSQFGKNVSIFSEFLPYSIESLDYKSNVKADALRVLNYISDPEYIAFLLLVDEMYFYVANMEKAAQAEQFRPIDYIKVNKEFRSMLESKLDSTLDIVKDVLEMGRVQNFVLI